MPATAAEAVATEADQILIMSQSGFVSIPVVMTKMQAAVVSEPYERRREVPMTYRPATRHLIVPSYIYSMLAHTSISAASTYPIPDASPR